MPKIETPTRVLWGTGDSVLRVEWADDRLGGYFADYSFTPAHEEAGHVVHYERLKLANRKITEFFRELR